jgi:protein-S-isoprenylcysteine O-methyltransferase Ste14
MPPELKAILLLSILNPAAIIVGYLVGRRADQPQKIIVAAFAAGLAGALFARLLMALGLTSAQPRLIAGILIVAAGVGSLAAWLGWRSARRG